MLNQVVYTKDFTRGGRRPAPARRSIRLVMLQGGVEVRAGIRAGQRRVVLKPVQFANQLHDLGAGERAGSVEALGRTRAGGQRDDDRRPAVTTGQAQGADGCDGEDGGGHGHPFRYNRRMVSTVSFK